MRTAANAKMLQITDLKEYFGGRGSLGRFEEVLFWLPPRDSNLDMLIQSLLLPIENKERNVITSAGSGKVRQNPHPTRTKTDRHP